MQDDGGAQDHHQGEQQGQHSPQDVSRGVPVLRRPITSEEEESEEEVDQEEVDAELEELRQEMEETRDNGPAALQ